MTTKSKGPDHSGEYLGQGDRSGRDVSRTANVQTSTERLESALRFQELVFSKSEDLLFVKDADFRIVQANPAFLSAYPEEIRDCIIGTTTFESYREDEREEFIKEDRRALETGFSETQESIQFPDGRRRILWTKKIGFGDEDGNRFILGIARDITALKQTEDALLTSNSELEEFSYRVSHDIRSPLVSARQLIKMSQDALSGGEQTVAETYLGAAADSLEKLDRLAEEILSVSRVRLGERQNELIDLPRLVDEIWTQLTAHDDDAPQLETEYALGQPIYADRDTLYLVLDNLLSNAFKYQDPERDDAQVQIRIESDDGHLNIAVTDNGIGIPPESHEQVFKMFQRFHPGHSAGSGLGLYMVQKCAERLAGRVTIVHLEPGTRFIFQIPLEPTLS
ncbi:MAG: ATP-binding protein [Myxococcota bacterium]